MSLFSFDVRANDPLYERIRDSVDQIGVRAKNTAESLWQEYELYADPAFLRNIADDFQARYWEMYLTVSLLRAGCTIEKKRKAQGPDIAMTYDRKRIWIEAVTPDSGNPSFPDSVPGFKPQPILKANPVPDDQFSLRLLAVIKYKLEQWNKYVGSGWVSSNDHFIVAVNTCKIPLAFVDQEIPRLARCAYAIGNQYITLNKRTAKVVGQGYKYRAEIKKQSSGELVPTGFFLDKNYRAISAVLSSHVNAASAIDAVGSSDMMKDYIAVHNLNATKPVKLIEPIINYTAELSSGNLTIKRDERKLKISKK